MPLSVVGELVAHDLSTEHDHPVPLEHVGGGPEASVPPVVNEPLPEPPPPRPLDVPPPSSPLLPNALPLDWPRPPPLPLLLVRPAPRPPLELLLQPLAIDAIQTDAKAKAAKICWLTRTVRASSNDTTTNDPPITQGTYFYRVPDGGGSVCDVARIGHFFMRAWEMFSVRVGVKCA